MRAGRHVAVWGAGGAIGDAFVKHLAAAPDVAEIFAVSRAPRPAPAGKIRTIVGDLTVEDDVAAAAATVTDAGGNLDLVLIARAFCMTPPPASRQRKLAGPDAAMARVFAVNTIGPSSHQTLSAPVGARPAGDFRRPIGAGRQYLG